MDNGRTQNTLRVSAKELTDEINRETDLALAAGAEEQGLTETMLQVRQTPTVSHVQAERMGWKVLEGGKAQVELGKENGSFGVVRDSENLQSLGGEVKQEILRDEDELSNPTDYVGVESELQVQERLADAKENLRNEDDPKRDFEAKIATSSQEKIAQSAIAEVDKIINHGHFSPFELQQAYRKIGNVMLESFEVPHPIGKGNG